MSIQLDMQRTVRQRYQILLRAHIHAELPDAYPRIADFYRSAAQRCMDWAEGEFGARLFAEYTELETLRQRSEFGVHRIQFTIRLGYEDARILTVLCERRAKGARILPKEFYYLCADVWNKRDEMLMPMRQVQHLLRIRDLRRACEFAPDGLYPNEEGIPIAYLNAGSEVPFRERRFEADRRPHIFP